jgi:CHASE3 domain sensor protein
MFNSIREELESTVTPIMRDIFEDARALMRQEAELLRAETRRESRRVARIAALLIMSSVFTFSAILLGLFAIAYTIAASDPHYTLGFSFSVVAAGAAVIALVISYWSLRQWRALTAESRKTFDALKEGVAWMQRTM